MASTGSLSTLHPENSSFRQTQMCLHMRTFFGVYMACLVSPLDKYGLGYSMCMDPLGRSLEGACPIVDNSLLWVMTKSVG